MDEKEEETGTIEPEEIICWLNDRNALDDISTLHDIDGHPRNDHLKLCSHQEDHLRSKKRLQIQSWSVMDCSLLLCFLWLEDTYKQRDKRQP